LELLPHFNPDLDTEDALPDAVRILRTQIGEADAILICVPEYAHGIPGSFKNMLDWLVGSTSLVEKPTAIWMSTTRSIHAPAQLREILTTMAAFVDEKSSFAIDVPCPLESAEALLALVDFAAGIQTAADSLLVSAQAFRDARPF
jgi:chromate reductase, NAD(P)H dehydrogenase (quinone)